MSKEEREEKMDRLAYAYCMRMENPDVKVYGEEIRWKKFHQMLLKKEVVR